MFWLFLVDWLMKVLHWNNFQQGPNKLFRYPIFILTHCWYSNFGRILFRDFQLVTMEVSGNELMTVRCFKYCAVVSKHILRLSYRKILLRNKYTIKERRLIYQNFTQFYKTIFWDSNASKMVASREKEWYIFYTRVLEGPIVITEC